MKDISEKQKIIFDQTMFDFLYRMRIPTHLKGYKYLKASIFITAVDYDGEIPEMNMLYEQVANRYDTTGDIVERDIRHAINVAWKCLDHSDLAKIFGLQYGINGTGKPSNKEWISYLACVANLKMRD